MPPESGESDASEGGSAGAGGDRASDGGRAGVAEPDPPRGGDGRLDRGEKCDDSANNGLGKACNARCAPDCSRIVGVEHIIISSKELPSSDLAPNRVASADSTCPVGYKALFAAITARRATTVPFQAQTR